MASKKERIFPVKYPKNASEIFDEIRARCSPRVVLGGCGVRSDVPGAVFVNLSGDFSFFPYLKQWGPVTAFTKIAISSNWAGGFLRFFNMLYSDDGGRLVPRRNFEFQLRSLITNV